MITVKDLSKFWLQLTERFSTNKNLILTCWREIESNYSDSSRHYHDMNHVHHMINLALEYKENVLDLDTLLFSIFYHDIVYDARKKDNEERSADLAVDRLKQLNVTEKTIQKCKAQILATKSHGEVNDEDTKLLLDIDLSALGGSWELYKRYYKGVRKEYNMYPDLLYKPGRRKVLNHFLAMKSIYQTDLFKAKFEIKAKENLRKELELLS